MSNKNDLLFLKILADLGLHKEQPLTDQQEQQFRLAVDDEARYYNDIINLFSKDKYNQLNQS